MLKGLTTPPASSKQANEALRHCVVEEGAAVVSPGSLEGVSVDSGRRPDARHVAIIMDGNGRWARARRMPRLAGHRRGADTAREILKACPDLGIDILSASLAGPDYRCRDP